MALDGTNVDMPCKSDERRRCGYELTGASCHDEPKGCAQKKEGVTLNLMRYLAVAEHDGMAGGEGLSGGSVRATMTTTLR